MDWVSSISFECTEAHLRREAGVPARYIQNPDFTLFAWYRIVFGALILILA